MAAAAALRLFAVFLAGLAVVSAAEDPRAAPERAVKVEHISWQDMPPEPVHLGTAKPDLVHKFAWALPGVLGRDLVNRLQHFGYDRSPVPAHTVRGGPSSLLEKGAGKKKLSVHQRTHKVTKKELDDAKHAIGMFVLERARRQVDGHDMESALKIYGATGKLFDKAQKHMEELGTVRIV